jgi:chromosome segregation ATPase
MTQPYTDAEVNAAVAASVDELKARIQQLETYSRADAETITQLQGRVGELEAENARLVESPTHTPGPWIVKYDDQYDHVFTRATPHRRIANVFGGIRGSSDFDLENQANAALIARAPELQARVTELERALTIDGIEDLIKTRDRLESELAHSNCYLRKSEEFCAKADAEIARLRELLRASRSYIITDCELAASIDKELDN